MNVPAHVPAELVYPFDHLRDEELLKDPHPRLVAIAEKFPGGDFLRYLQRWALGDLQLRSLRQRRSKYRYIFQ